MPYLLRKRSVLAGLFLTTAAAAALLYWGIWQTNPDYFLVQREVNLYPIACLGALLWGEEIRALPNHMSGLDELSGEASGILSGARALRERQANLESHIRQLEGSSAELYSVLEQNRQKRIEEFKSQELGPLDEQRAKLEGQVVALEGRLPPDQGSYDSQRVLAAEMRVELARQNLRIAEKRVEVMDRIVKDYGGFARSEDVDRWKSVDNQVASVRAELNEITAGHTELRRRAFELMGKWRNERVRLRLGLVDFLYFSLGVSTTTTFGDIVPNHALPRAVVTVQLLLSIVIVGLFVNSLSADLTARRQPSNQPNPGMQTDAQKHARG